MINDDLKNKILNEVRQTPGIRLGELSRKLNRNMITIRYRLLMMERDGELKIERAERLFKAYPLKEAGTVAGGDANGC